MRFVMFGHNDWWVWERQGFCTRNAALARELAGREVVSELLVVDTPRYRGRTHRPAESRGDETTVVAPGISAVRYGYPLPLPATWYPGRRLNERLTSAALTRRLGAARAAGEATVLWVADPRLVEADGCARSMPKPSTPSTTGVSTPGPATRPSVGGMSSSLATRTSCSP